MATALNVPYRCPNCGDLETFTSLQKLRAHFQTEHSYLFSRIKNGSFDYKSSRRSSLLDMYHADARNLEENLKKSKEDEQNSKRLRSHDKGSPSSPLINVTNNATSSSLPKYRLREYGNSSRLNRHIYPNKYNNLDRSRYLVFHQPSHDSNIEAVKIDTNQCEDRKYSGLDNMFSRQPNLQIVHSAESYSKPPNFRLPHRKLADDEHIVNTLTTLSHEVLLERANQHATADSLYTTQEMLSGVEKAAEEKISKQKLLIDALAEELKVKERRLANLMYEMETLHCQQLDSMKKVNLLKSKYDNGKEQLDQELQQKQIQLDSLSKEIRDTQQSILNDSKTAFRMSDNHSEDDTFYHNKLLNDNSHLPSLHVSSEHVNNEQISTCSVDGVGNSEQEKHSVDESSFKEKEMAFIRKKAQHLEKDRQNLLIEMQNLLDAATSDSDKLRTELDSQTQKLSRLNSDLEQTKQEQVELLDETSALYHQADASLSILKSMLKEREHQLMFVSGSLEQAKAKQKKLTKERDKCFRLAKERAAMYKSMLAANSLQVTVFSVRKLIMKQILNVKIKNIHLL